MVPRPGALGEYMKGKQNMMKRRQIAPGEVERSTTGKRTFTYDGNAESKHGATSSRQSRSVRKETAHGKGLGLWVLCLTVAGLFIALVSNHWETQEVKLVETSDSHLAVSLMEDVESDGPEPLPGLAEPVQEGIPEMLQRVNQSTVVIVTQNEDSLWLGMGSGFMVGENGEIATNYHVIEGDYEGWVKIPGKEKPLPIQSILHKDPGSDLAVIRVDTKTVPLALSSFDSAKVGEKIFALGNPKGLEGTVSNGIISSKRESSAELGTFLRDGTKLIQVTAATSPGSSGGPIVNEQGEVLAMVQGGYKLGQNLNFGISMDHLKLLMQTERLDLAFNEENLPRRLHLRKPFFPIHPDHTTAGSTSRTIPAPVKRRAGNATKAKADQRSKLLAKQRAAETAKRLASESQRRRAYIAEIADAYLDQGQAAYLRSNYDTALAFHSRALQLHQEFPMGKDETIATLYNEIGAVCAAMGRHRKAIQYYEKALVMLKEILGPEHSRVATCHNNIGASLLAQNDKLMGKKHLVKAMVIFHKRFGADHANTRTAREWLESI